MSFPIYWNVIDLGDEAIRDTRITLAQIKISKEMYNSKYQLKDIYRDNQSNKIINYIKNASIEKSNFVVFPELSIPINIFEEIINISHENDIYVLGGLEYDKEYHNKYVLCTPNGDSYIGVKNYASIYDHINMKTSTERNIFINSGYGDFLPLMCFDYTNSDIISEVRGSIDNIFVIACNPDVNTFHLRALDDAWKGYCFITICNSASFGGSGIYGPINKINEVYVEKIIKRSIGVGETIDRVDVPIRGLYNSTNYLHYKFKSKPAGYIRKKIETIFVENSRLNKFIQEIRNNPSIYGGYFDGRSLFLSFARLLSMDYMELGVFLKENIIVLPNFYSRIIKKEIDEIILKVRQIRYDINKEGVLVSNMIRLGGNRSIIHNDDLYYSLDDISNSDNKDPSKYMNELFINLRKRGFKLGIPICALGDIYRAIWLLSSNDYMFLSYLPTQGGIENEIMYYHWLKNNEMIIICYTTSKYCPSVDVIIKYIEKKTGKKIIEFWIIFYDSNYANEIDDTINANKNIIYQYRKMNLNIYMCNKTELNSIIKSKFKYILS